jgi:RNA polymerase sigma-70 factor, ECF subfamily
VVIDTGLGQAPPDDVVGDRALVERAVGGDRAAFATLVERHHGRIIALLERLCGCADQARDLAQETFISAFRHLSGFRHESRFSTWLHSIACNHAAAAARRRRPTVSLDATSPDGTTRIPEPAARMADVAAGLEQAELRSRVTAALARLDERYRQVVVLSDMQGSTYEEIAQALGIPIGTVRSRLHRGRLELRSLLAAE